jgi:hypothetical protein
MVIFAGRRVKETRPESRRGARIVARRDKYATPRLIKRKAVRSRAL